MIKLVLVIKFFDSLEAIPNTNIEANTLHLNCLAYFYRSDNMYIGR